MYSIFKIKNDFPLKMNCCNNSFLIKMYDWVLLEEYEGTDKRTIVCVVKGNTKQEAESEIAKRLNKGDLNNSNISNTLTLILENNEDGDTYCFDQLRIECSQLSKDGKSINQRAVSLLIKFAEEYGNYTWLEKAKY